jgi:CheY-like chemotaxis protein
MRVLFITNRQRTGGWLADAFVADNAPAVHLEEVGGSAAGLARLRDEAYDAVLVSHEPGELDAIALAEAHRTGGADDPLVVLGTQSEQEMASRCFEVGADAYVCVNTTTTRSLVWIVGRAVQRHELIRENRRLTLNEQQRLQREHDEAEHILLQQRMLISDLESIRRPEKSPSGLSVADDAQDRDAPSEPRAARRDKQPADRDEPTPAVEFSTIGLPDELVQHYRELLRTYVIMGSGNLGCELSRLAELFTTAGVTTQQTMQLHLRVLEELIHGLGARSTRHVMTRADLLVLEIMMHLAEGYRRRYCQRLHPPVQRMLPGFEEPPMRKAS